MRRRAWLLAAVAAAVIANVAVAWNLGLQRWLSYETGSENTATPPHNYNFFSGSGSIILPPVLNGGAFAVALWWHNRCHVHGCLRYARRKTAAGDRACRRHHPDGRLTLAELRSRHHLYLGKQPGRG